MAYIHELKTWPNFHWSKEPIAERLVTISHRQGRLIGKMEALGFNLSAEAELQTLTEEVVKSSEIEGEYLDRAQVRSSLARRLGMDIGAITPADRHVEGFVAMMLEATQKYAAPLTKKRLLGWHASLFPTGESGLRRIRVGKWRDDKLGPMQVVSGPIGRETVHYTAPASNRLTNEMGTFLDWFNGKGLSDGVLKAAISHLWFVTIHPFEDGNGRMARVITDMMLARSEKSPRRFYSMSAQIRIDRKDYYDILETTQKSTLDITSWLNWFLGCLDRAILGAETTLGTVLKKARFWETRSRENFNARQRKIINQLMDGFEGKLTSTKWAKLGKCSQDTASRDIDELIQRGILIKNPAGGRSTSYSLVDF